MHEHFDTLVEITLEELVDDDIISLIGTKIGRETEGLDAQFYSIKNGETVILRVFSCKCSHS